MKRFLGSLLFLGLCAISGSAQIEVPHKTEEVAFQKDQFRVVGELRLPKEGDKHPLIIMVHGDGPAYRTYFAKLKEVMLGAGYATLMWDKPGFGRSKGEFSGDHLREERAGVLVAAIDHMKSHPQIEADRIGVWGISQAGIVIPMALQKTEDVSFMILVGCPGENGIQQTAYLIRRQLEFGGLSKEEAEEAERHFIQLYYAESFEQYIEHAQPLYDNPVQRELGFVSALWDKENWKPHTRDEEGFYDPMRIMEQVTVPVLVFFGEKDTQVDPIQGIEAYEAALNKAGNQNFRGEIIPGSDHNIILSDTGGMQERNRRSSEDWRNYSPEYLKIMEEWLKKLRSK
jgi:pimeloyl-ACP methyl ester carboxylesterase